jgi:hypothetical protein
VVIEPGAYRTQAFTNMVTAADQGRTETYGPVKEFGAKIGAAVSAAAGHPQELADAVLRIMETPAGQRQLRYRVSGAGLGVEEINAVCERVQQRMLEAFGLSGEVAWAQRTAAGS